MAITHAPLKGMETTTIDLTNFIDVELLLMCLNIPHGFLFQTSYRTIYSSGSNIYKIDVTDHFGDFDKDLLLYRFWNYEMKRANITEWFLKIERYDEDETEFNLQVNVSKNAIQEFIDEVKDVIPLDCLINCSVEELNTMIEMYYQAYNLTDEIKKDSYKIYVIHMKNKISQGFLYE